jgi:AcrR family transcriptional regulator
MEAATAPEGSPATAPERPPARELPGDNAARIVEAMRASVAAKGIAGSTFDHVAREAGVSRGLLHYYFGTKERLLVEVVRRECQVRGELLHQAVAGADGADELIDALVRSFEELLGEGSSQVVMFYELLTLAQRNDDIATELAELSRTLRLQLAEALRAGSQAGVFELRGDPGDVACFLLALADGVMIRRMSEPELDVRRLMDQAVAAARALLA